MLLATSLISSLVGYGLDFVADFIDGEEDGVTHKVCDAIKEVTDVDIRQKDELENMTPAQKKKFVEGVKKHEQEIMRIRLEQYKVETQDVKDARAAQNEKEEDKDRGWLARNFLYLLSGFVVVSCIAYFFVVYFFPGKTASAYTDQVHTVLIAAFLQILNFFTGNKYNPTKTPPKPKKQKALDNPTGFVKGMVGKLLKK